MKKGVILILVATLFSVSAMASGWRIFGRFEDDIVRVEYTDAVKGAPQSYTVENLTEKTVEVCLRAIRRDGERAEACTVLAPKEKIQRGCSNCYGITKFEMVRFRYLDNKK